MAPRPDRRRRADRKRHPPTDLVGFNDTVSSVAENGGTVKVSVTRTGPINQQGTVTYTTELPAGSTATADDFTATTGVLTFAPGDATESFTVPITDDTADESDETFGVRLQAPISASMNLATPPTSTVNIVDNDDTPVTPVPPVVQAGRRPAGTDQRPGAAAGPLDQGQGQLRRGLWSRADALARTARTERPGREPQRLRQCQGYVQAQSR